MMQNSPPSGCRKRAQDALLASAHDMRSERHERAMRLERELAEAVMQRDAFWKEWFKDRARAVAAEIEVDGLKARINIQADTIFELECKLTAIEQRANESGTGSLAFSSWARPTTLWFQ